MHKMTAKILVTCLILQCIQSIYPPFVDYQALTYEMLRHLPTLPLALCTVLVHMFSHAGWGHLLGNFSIGLPFLMYAEGRVGGKKLLELYVISGLVAVALQYCMPLPSEGCIGSSGAIFGVLGASCLLYGEGKEAVSKALGMALLALWLVPQFMALQMSFLGSNIANAAHIGGALAGMLWVHLTRACSPNK